ncbi:hypothetical protein ABFV05_020509 [Capra hircus]
MGCQFGVRRHGSVLALIGHRVIAGISSSGARVGAGSPATSALLRLLPSSNWRAGCYRHWDGRAGTEGERRVALRRFFSGEFETRSQRNLPADQGQETGTGLTGLLRAGPEPANRSAAPPAKRRIFPDTLTSCACCYGSADGWLSGGGLAGPLREIPFLSLVLTGIPLTFASRLSSPLRENPAETMTLLPGLRRFGFCGLQVAVLLHSVAGPVFPPPFAL